MEVPMSASGTDALSAQYSWLNSVIANAERYGRSAFEEPMTRGVVLNTESLALQHRLFRRALKHATMLFARVRTAVAEWRQAIEDLQIVRDASTETQIWELVSCWISLAEFLISMANLYYQKGTVLCNHSALRPVQSGLDEAKQIRANLDTVQDPIDKASKSLVALFRGMSQGAKLDSSPLLDELVQKAIQAQEETHEDDEKAWADRLTNDLLASGD
jgi:hypothetical protein